MQTEPQHYAETITELTAPSVHTLTDPKAFDDFRSEPTWQECLSLVKDNPEPICQIRYAWLLSHQNKPEISVHILERFKDHPLGYAFYMDALVSLGWNEVLLDALSAWQPHENEFAEATIIGYEATAYVYAELHKDSQSALRFLYRAEALAMYCQLGKRLQVIHTNLEYVANGFDLDIPLEKIRYPDVSSSGIVQVNRFQSYLRTLNFSALKDDPHISPASTRLAQATLLYKDWFWKPKVIVDAAHLISDNLSSLPEFQIYWSLLMLQIYAQRGALKGLASPSRIIKVLSQATQFMKPLELRTACKFISRHYPLGCAVAAHLDDRFQFLIAEVGVVWADLPRDGIRFGSEKPITISSRVREALLEDGLHATNHHTKAVFRLHGEYRRRLNHVLDRNELQLTDTTTISAVYRGLDMLSSDLGESSIHEKAQETLANSSYLQKIVSL